MIHTRHAHSILMKLITESDITSAAFTEMADIMDNHRFTANLSPIKSADASHFIGSVEDCLLNVSADLEIQTEAYHICNYCGKCFKLAWLPGCHTKSHTQYLIGVHNATLTFLQITYTRGIP
ncbi:hypothetical protein ACF0H5_014824 [Mactra antiquata]